MKTQENKLKILIEIQNNSIQNIVSNGVIDIHIKDYDSDTFVSYDSNEITIEEFDNLLISIGKTISGEDFYELCKEIPVFAAQKIGEKVTEIFFAETKEEELILTKGEDLTLTFHWKKDEEIPCNSNNGVILGKVDSDEKYLITPLSMKMIENLQNLIVE